MQKEGFMYCQILPKQINRSWLSSKIALNVYIESNFDIENKNINKMASYVSSFIIGAFANDGKTTFRHSRSEETT